jgi:cell division protein FtsQ
MKAAVQQKPFPLKPARKKKKSRRKGHILAWLTPRLLKRLVVFSIIFSCVLWLLKDDGIARLRTGFYAFTANHNLAIADIKIEGRHRTSAEEILSTLNVNIGDSLFQFDTESAHTKILELPWVNSVLVQRQFPNRIRIVLNERVPLAIWQNQGNFYVIDKLGKKIEKISAQDFPDFLIVVGDNAPAQALTLMTLLAEYPEVRKAVVSASWIGNRRWNLYLSNSVEVRLPDDDPLKALKTLEQAEKQYGLLQKNIVRIDLRMPDRMIVKPKDEKSAAEQSTTSAP